MTKITLTMLIVITIVTIIPNIILIRNFITGEWNRKQPTEWGFFHFLCLWFWVAVALVALGEVVYSHL